MLRKKSVTVHWSSVRLQHNINVLVLDTNIIHVLIYKNFSMLHSNQNHV